MHAATERIIVGIGRVLGTVADLLPGGGDDWCERDYERAVRRAEKVLPEDGGEALEPVSMRFTDALKPEARDTEWISSYGTHWRWKGDRWESLQRGSKTWGDTPVGYTPQASGPFTAIEPQKREMDWRGWAVPAILEVLAEHHLRGPVMFGQYYCANDSDEVCDGNYDAAWEWREHIAPLIADRIACDPRRAIKALQASDSLNL
jgi:hypothetical protein